MASYCEDYWSQMSSKDCRTVYPSLQMMKAPEMMKGVEQDRSYVPPSPSKCLERSLDDKSIQSGTAKGFGFLNVPPDSGDLLLKFQRSTIGLNVKLYNPLIFSGVIMLIHNH